MAAYVPSRGDIIHLQFDPAAGHEMKGPHFALVVSGKEMNARGLAFACPISQGSVTAARTHGTVVTLMGAGTDTQGAVHCHQLKSLDWRERKAKFKERIPQPIIDEVCARLDAIING
ncbi:MAG: type II toxin-antitoxin system PemK/MazF family toxin [Herminiimonas sp.]|nr:type II toxin-antitoxin system PemK/MazF family toxin [Herminiimonas sp.]